MNTLRYNNIELDKLRSYSSVFSRSVFTRLVKFKDYSTINSVCRTYDSDYLTPQTTYGDYLKWMYFSMVAKYRTEYVFKNALVNKILALNKHRNITVFNEFRVGDSIADLATFNGRSCVYEIKTALDSPKRLAGQSQDYFRFFQECYLVIPKDQLKEYLTCTDDRMGIITVNERSGSTTVSKYRKATLLTDNMDVDVLMKVLWIQEYESIVKKYFGSLPDVGYFDMYDACREKLRLIPVEKLSKMAVEVIKKRKKNDVLFDNELKNLTQICLALNLNARQYEQMCVNLNETIKL